MQKESAELRLIKLAAQLLNVTIRSAEAGSQPADVQEAVSAQVEGKLYPRLTITAPHNGGGILLDAVLCDPVTDAIVVRLLSLEAIQQAAH